MKREKQIQLQKEAVELIKEHKRLILQWCTGLGKSKAAIDIISELYNVWKRDNISVLLVVAEIAHKKNWKLEFDKWMSTKNALSQNITIDTYASLKNHRSKHYDLIILDEAHHAGSDLRLDILSEVTADYILALSATLPDNLIESLEELYGEFANSTVSLRQAIEWEILPEPKIYLIPLELDNTYPTQTIIEEWGLSAKRLPVKTDMQGRWEYLKNKLKYPNMRLEIKCTERQKYDYLNEKMEYWKKTYFRMNSEALKNKWLQAGSIRKRFMGDMKTTVANQLLRIIRRKKKRFICFCTSIEQSEALGGRNSIHSKKKNSLSIIDKFNDKKIDELFAIGMLQEGQNLTDIEIGIIIQLDGQDRSFVQKFGRSMRAEDPVQFIIYYKNTRDEEYLEKILEDINPEYITVVENLQDLKI